MKVHVFGHHHKMAKDLEIRDLNDLKLTSLIKKYNNWSCDWNNNDRDYMGVKPPVHVHSRYVNIYGKSPYHICQLLNTVVYFQYKTNSVEGVRFETEADAVNYWKNVLGFKSVSYEVPTGYQYMDDIVFDEDYYSELTGLTYRKNKVYKFYLYLDDNKFSIAPTDGFNMTPINIPGTIGSRQYIFDEIPLNLIRPLE